MNKLIFALALSAITTTSCFAAASPQIGIWEFNAAKSRIPSGIGKNSTVISSEQGDKIKVVMDGVDGDGRPKHSVWIGRFDGRPYPVKGTDAYDSTSYRVTNEHNAIIKAFKDGRLMWWGTISISNDGNTRTANLQWIDANGKKATTKKVYNKAMSGVPSIVG